MNVSRNFVLLGTAFLIAGLIVGMYMGASEDHSLTPSHAHLNLLGFVLSILFALTYKVFAEMGASGLARLHFWLHAIGATVLNILVFLMHADFIGEEAMMPLAPISELAVFLGILVFGFNALKNAR